MNNNDFDFNFKLVLIENLLYNSKNEKPSFQEEYNEILNSKEYKEEEKNIIDNFLYDDVCKTLYNYLMQLIISDDDILKIKDIYFDGGSQIYIDLAPSWDGESDIFNVQSIKGIEKLKNLKSVNAFSMTNKNVEKELRELNCEVWIDDGEASVFTQ